MLRRLSGPRVNEIERIALERCARDLERRLRFRDRVNAAEALQVIIAQRLKAHRHAIDARRAIALEAPRFDAARIGFERDLGIAIDRPQLRDLVEDRRDRLRLHQRRRTAAKEDAAHLPGADARRHRIQLSQIGARKRSSSQPPKPHVPIEIAIRALLRAKRPVDVNAKVWIAVSATHTTRGQQHFGDRAPRGSSFLAYRRGAPAAVRKYPSSVWRHASVLRAGRRPAADECDSSSLVERDAAAADKRRQIPARDFPRRPAAATCSRHSGLKASNARVRWEMAYFSSGSISPNVAFHHRARTSDRSRTRCRRVAARPGAEHVAVEHVRLAIGPREAQYGYEVGTRPAANNPALPRVARGDFVGDLLHGKAEVFARPRPARRVDAGCPAQPSTSRPESSASAGRPEPCAAATALSFALPSNVTSVSSGSARPNRLPKSRRGHKARSAG